MTVVPCRLTLILTCGCAVIADRDGYGNLPRLGQRFECEDDGDQTIWSVQIERVTR